MIEFENLRNNVRLVLIVNGIDTLYPHQKYTGLESTIQGCQRYDISGNNRL